MNQPISAAEANRHFSQILRRVREDGVSYVVTSHGKPVARVVPYVEDAVDPRRAAACKALLTHLRTLPTFPVEPWTRDELHQRG